MCQSPDPDTTVEYRTERGKPYFRVTYRPSPDYPKLAVKVHTEQRAWGLANLLTERTSNG